MSRLILLILSGGALLLLVYCCTDYSTSKPDAAPSGLLERQSNDKQTTFGISPVVSPFGLGNPTPPNIEDLVRFRKQLAIKDGYLLPEKYFRMGVAELTKLGNGGDPLASIAMGDRYMSEANTTLPFDPAMDFSDAPKNIASHFYIMATRGGAGFIPSVVSKRMLEAGDILEAAAWDMVAQKFNGNNQPASTQSPFKNMSYEQMNAAYLRAEQLQRAAGI